MVFSSRKTPLSVLLFFTILMLFAGVIGFFATFLNIPILKLWKEFFVLILFLVGILFNAPHYSIKPLYTMYGFTLFFALVVINSLFKSDLQFILYQLKLDAFIALFGIAVYYCFNALQSSSILSFYKTFIKIILGLGILNSLAIIAQHFFTSQFYSLVGLGTEDWGSSTGVKIITAADQLRAPGLQLTFVASGSLMLLCIVLLLESRKIHKYGTSIIVLLLSVFLISLYFSTYKTALIAAGYYFAVKTLSYIFKKFATVMVTICSVIVLCYFFMSTHFMNMYYFFAKFNEYYAYNSIYIRIQQHLDILKQFHSWHDYLFGVGMGVNGRFGLERANDVLATDSTYIYLLSNYGFIATAAFALALLGLIIKFFNHSHLDVLGVRYMLLYLLCIEFFYNNSIVNFPCNMIYLTLIISTYLYSKKCIKEESTEIAA